MPLDPKALSAHIDAVRALARALLGDEDAADDVAQDAAVIALESGATMHSPRGWFAGVARNLSRRKIRDRTRRRRREHAAARPELQVDDPAALVGRATEQRRVLDHLVKLDDPYRDVLLLRFFEGLPPREIAKRRNTPVETVRTQVRRGVAQLRERLETELRTDDRTWQQGLALAAGLGATITRRIPETLAPKVAVAAGVLLALGGTVWWAVDTLQSSAADMPIDESLEELPTTIVAVEKPQAEPTTLSVPEHRPPKPVEQSRKPAAEPVATTDVPAPTVAATENLSRRARARLRDEARWRSRQDHAPVSPARARSLKPEPIHVPFQTTDAGMVQLPAARIRIGSAQAWAQTFARSGEARPLVGVEYEAPMHFREIAEVFFDRFEVSNAQYEIYLRSMGLVEGFETGDGKTRTLSEVVKYLWGPEALVVNDLHAAYQLYMANFAILIDRVPSRVVRTLEGEIDHDRTFRRFYARELPRGIPLNFYARPIPPDWVGMAPVAHKRDHPVVGIAYVEALAFAEWAGKHIPTEFEWEYAARGGGSWDWPWGSDARGFKGRVNGGYARTLQNPADTAPVNTWVEGRSPFDCYHMLGNASEWTSSRLLQYPDLRRPAYDDGVPRWVIRGGSANNVAQGAVRPMFRGWEDPRRMLKKGSRAELAALAPVTPSGFLRVPWAGFRCAWYEELGVSRTYTMRQRLMVSSDIPPEIVQADHYAGLEVNDFALPGAIVVEGKYVQGGAHSLVLQPFKVALAQLGDEQLRVLSKPGLTDLPSLQAELAKRPLYLGLFHTDWPLQLTKARVYPADANRDPTWYGPKELTGTYVIYYAQERVWLWHLMTGRQFRLGRATFRVREGAEPLSKAESKVTLRAQSVRRSLEGRVDLRLMVPFSTQNDSKHLQLDVTAAFDVGYPKNTDRPILRPESIGR